MLATYREKLKDYGEVIIDYNYTRNASGEVEDAELRSLCLVPESLCPKDLTLAIEVIEALTGLEIELKLRERILEKI